jgi:hypothetical protein
MTPRAEETLLSFQSSSYPVIFDINAMVPMRIGQPLLFSCLDALR